MGNCLTKTKVCSKSQSSRNLRSKNKRTGGEKVAKRQATGEFSGRPDAITVTEAVSERKAESNEDCGVTKKNTSTRQITNKSDESESILVLFYSRVEESEVNEPGHPNDNIPFQEPIHNDSEDGEENDEVHIIGVTNADINEHSALINTLVFAVTEKHSVFVEDNVNKADEVDHSSLKSDFITERCCLRFHSQEGETNVIDADPTPLLELSGHNSNRKCHNYTSTENDSKISDKLKENTNDICIDLANNLDDIHTEDWSPFSPCASQQIHENSLIKKAPSYGVENSTMAW